jgi:hypothetical protein
LISARQADGKNGMRVVQLTSPESRGNDGFSPRPTPMLIATHRPPGGGCALSISEGVDSDRAVDESGNQIAVFGRVGAGPLTGPEQQRLYLKNGEVWRVEDLEPDYSIPDRRKREINLHQCIEKYYGDNERRRR